MMPRLFRSAFFPALVWTLVVFVLLIIPGEEFPEGPQVPLTDKIIHVFLFGVLAYLWGRYIKQHFSGKYLPYLFASFLFSSIFGIAMEFVQKFCVANRGFELGDIAADIMGSLVGWLLIRFHSHKQAGAKKNWPL